MLGFGKDRRKRRITIAILSVVLLLMITVLACMLYLMDYYKADMEAIDAFVTQSVNYEERDGMLVFGDETAEKGLIFYPGGKVDHTAYIPLMVALAEQGFFCVLVEMPFRLAVFDMDAADGIQNTYPDVVDWYIGGHSLGGAMAASYVAEHVDDYKGLLLLAAYSTEDLSASSLAVLSIYGSEDGVLDKETYEENRKNLPKNKKEYVIDGGCHAYFGMYGEQDGDGKATISGIEQIRLTANAVCDYFK